MKTLTYFLLCTMALTIPLSASYLEDEDPDFLEAIRLSKLEVELSGDDSSKNEHWYLEQRYDEGEALNLAIEMSLKEQKPHPFHDLQTGQFKSGWNINPSITPEFTDTGMKLKNFHNLYKLGGNNYFGCYPTCFQEHDGKEITIMARVKSNVANVYRMRIIEYTGDQWAAPSTSALHSGNNTWETLMLTHTLAQKPTQRYVMFLNVEAKPQGYGVNGDVEIANLTLLVNEPGKQPLVIFGDLEAFNDVKHAPRAIEPTKEIIKEEKDLNVPKKQEINNGDVTLMAEIFVQVRNDFQKQLEQLERNMYPHDCKMITFEQLFLYGKESGLNRLFEAGDMDSYNHYSNNYENYEKEYKARKETLIRMALDRGYKSEKDKRYLIAIFCDRSNATLNYGQEVYNKVMNYDYED